MNKLNNIVVENLSLEFGQESKKTFEELGVDTGKYEFSQIKEDYFYFYGVINNKFKNYSLHEVKQSNAKIITLKELKAMKNPYPKMMYVSDEPITDKKNGEQYEVLKEVEIENQSIFITKSKLFDDKFFAYKYAVDLNHFDNQVKEITIEEIAQRFGYPIKQIRIKK